MLNKIFVCFFCHYFYRNFIWQQLISFFAGVGMAGFDILKTGI